MPVSAVKWSAVSFCRSFICGLLTMRTLTSSPPPPPLPPAPPHPDSASAPTMPMAAQMAPRPVIRCFIVVPSLVFAGLLPAVGFAARKSYERRCSYVQYCVTNPSDVQDFTYERSIDVEGRVMSTVPTARHRRFLAQLARDHYLEGRSKVEIGKANGLSRFPGARLLGEAGDAAVVASSVGGGAGEEDGAAERIASALGRGSVGIGGLPDGADACEQMGRAALPLVGRQARPGMRIGLSWSRTLDSAAAFTPALPRCTIVQLAGALRLESHRPSAEIFTRLGQDHAVSMVRLPAPLLVTEAETAADLRALPEISGTLAAADDLDLAVVSVASWAEGLSSVWEK